MSLYDDAIANTPGIDTRNYGTGPFNADGTLKDGRNSLGNYSPLQMDGLGRFPDGSYYPGMGPNMSGGFTEEGQAAYDAKIAARTPVPQTRTQQIDERMQADFARREKDRLQSWLDRQDNLTSNVEKGGTRVDGTDVAEYYAPRMADRSEIEDIRAYLNDPDTAWGTSDPYGVLDGYYGHSTQGGGPTKYNEFLGQDYHSGKIDFEDWDINSQSYTPESGKGRNRYQPQQQQAQALRGAPQPQPMGGGRQKPNFIQNAQMGGGGGQAAATQSGPQQAGYKPFQPGPQTDARGNPMGSQQAQAQALRGGRQFSPFGQGMGQFSGQNTYGGAPRSV